MNRLGIGSVRDKEGGSHRRQKSRDKSSDNKKTRPLSSDGIMSIFKTDPQKKLDKEQSHKIKTIKHRLSDKGYLGVDEQQINYALQSKHAEGDLDKAIEMVILVQDSVDGVIKPINPAIQMKGAENRELVTCYLDALLFAMFSRLRSFEPILYTQSADEPTNRLKSLLRLWVNMLRTGILIREDITEHLQAAIAACGWEAAAELEQQDTSEAFTFITQTLNLPLLTLKMDIFHNGTEVDSDDHREIFERLLEVAVPDEPCTLEACLESFFNNRVEVMRPLERSNTLSSVKSARSPSDNKASAVHTEVVVSELSWSTPNTPLSTHPPRSPLSPGSRLRSESIIRHRAVTELQDEEKGEKVVDSDEHSPRKSMRKGSIRKEVLMPAWQFFNLLPWYTKSDTPSHDTEVATNFSHTPPVIGICLKRYAMSPDGSATRNSVYIDVPLDIRLPQFVDESSRVEGQPIIGNFKLSLQSVICHQGNSVQSGHYISFVREPAEIADGDSASSRRMSTSSQPPQYSTDRWIRHDDIVSERISYVDIEQILKEEMPYLLFYQVLPVHDFTQSPTTEPDPPAYERQAGIDLRVLESSPLTEFKPDDHQHGYFDDATTRNESAAPSIRFSADLERPRHSMQVPESRRGSTAPTENSLGSATSSVRAPEAKSNPVTPIEETTAQRLSRAASRIKSGSKSRPTSSSGENRISSTFSRIGLRSKEQLNRTEPGNNPVVSVQSVASLSTTDGATDRDSGVVMVDSSKLAGESPKRSKSTRGRKRGKSKEPETNSEKKEAGHHHHHHHQHKMKDGKAVPDRECTLM